MAPSTESLMWSAWSQDHMRIHLHIQRHKGYVLPMQEQKKEGCGFAF